VSDQFDLNALLNQAMEMQSQLIEAQAQAAEAEVTGTAGGGAVEITVTGSMQFVDVTISPDAVDPDDVAMLEDLVLAALNDAVAQIDAMQRASMPAIDLGSLGLGGLTDDAPAGGAFGFGGGGAPAPGGAPGGVIDVPSSTDADDERP
jgi:DNA-binding YbaB/EbfC family protein